MSTNFYGVGSNASALFNAYFGTNSSSTNSLYGSNSTSGLYSLTSSLGDLKMIQSGVYKKAMAAYYTTQDKDVESSVESEETDSNASLSTLKSAANDLKASSKALQSMDFDVTKAEDALDEVKSFVADYNKTINASKNMNTYSILQTAVWATEQMNASESLLNKAGISINMDNTLSVDEEKFKKADTSVLKTLFEGSNSVAARMTQKASALSNQSANQLVVNSGSRLYNMFGTLS